MKPLCDILGGMFFELHTLASGGAAAAAADDEWDLEAREKSL